MKLIPIPRGVTPIVNKELRPLLRGQRSFWLLLAALLAAGTVFLCYWNSTAAQSGNIGQAAYAGRRIFCNIALTLLVLLGLVSPVITATAVASERENNTLDLLLATGLAPWRILAGKLTASLAYQFIFTLCMLPILTLTLMLGGVGPDEIVFATLMIVTTVLTYGMIGLAVSCRLRKSASALALTLMIILSLALFIVGGAELFRGFRMLDEETFRLTIPLSPVATMLETNMQMERSQRVISMAPGTIPQLSPGVPSLLSAINQSFFDLLQIGTLQAHLALQAVLFIGSWLLALTGLRRRGADRHAVARRIIDDPAELLRRRKTWPYYLIDPQRRAQRIGDRQNPVYVKEQRVGSLARPHVLLRLCYLGALLSIPLGLPMISTQRADALPWLALGMLLPLALFILILAAGTLSREREEKTLDLLRVTPLSAWLILRAKFTIVLRFVLFLSLSMLVTPLILMVWSVLRTHRMHTTNSMEMVPLDAAGTIVLALLFTLAYTSFYTTLGLYCSSRCRRNATAVVLSFVLAIGLGASPFLIHQLDTLAIRMTQPKIVSVLSGAKVFAGRPRPRFLTRIENPPFDYERSRIHDAAKFYVDYLGPVLSPIYYLQFNPGYMRTHPESDHPLTHWDEWPTALTHALLVLSLAWLLLRLTALRLSRMRQ